MELRAHKRAMVEVVSWSFDLVHQTLELEVVCWLFCQTSEVCGLRFCRLRCGWFLDLVVVGAIWWLFVGDCVNQ